MYDKIAKIIVITTLILALVIWFEVSALLVFLASLVFGFKMSLVQIIFVFVVGIVIRGLLPSKE